MNVPPISNKPESRSYEDCVEDCYYASKFCYEKLDGTTICPIDLNKCIDECDSQQSA